MENTWNYIFLWLREKKEPESIEGSIKISPRVLSDENPWGYFWLVELVPALSLLDFLCYIQPQLRRSPIPFHLLLKGIIHQLSEYLMNTLHMCTVHGCTCSSTCKWVMWVPVCRGERMLSHVCLPHLLYIVLFWDRISPWTRIWGTQLGWPAIEIIPSSRITD